MKEKVEEFLKLKNQLTKELKKWVKDKSIPLEERWDVFVTSGLGKHDGCYFHFKSLDQDDFHADRNRHKVFNVDDVIEYFEEASEEEINKFKQEALNEFIFSWEFDW